jgi:diaminohydroxyphosphoribosylaminopyrimidine deaminase/5-amino-6-(5-phosphoribosylamino)uracil reductase
MGKPEKYFSNAIEIAEIGRGKTSPNPFVGAIIVKDEHIIGSGYTQPWGSDHAEIQALKAAGINSRGATMYVTLEPCCSYGKTPPCTDAIIKAGIAKVFVGITDPNPKVNGNGIKKLKENGVEVSTGFLKKEIRQQLEYYITWIEKKRPFVILKTAMTLDGYIAGADGHSKWITGSESRKRVHELRQESDAIISGIGTVLADDPQFNSRIEGASLQPLRVIMDSDLRIPTSSKIVRTAKEQQTVIFCSDGCDKKKIEELKQKGVMIEQRKAGDITPQAVLEYLYNRNLYCVMVEAGNKLSSAFIRAKVIDKYFIFLAPSIIGNGLKAYSLKENDDLAKKVELSFDKTERYGNDLLVIAYPII